MLSYIWGSKGEKPETKKNKYRDQNDDLGIYGSVPHLPEDMPREDLSASRRSSDPSPRPPIYSVD
jgi:hypothetical protein